MHITKTHRGFVASAEKALAGVGAGDLSSELFLKAVARVKLLLGVSREARIVNVLRHSAATERRIHRKRAAGPVTSSLKAILTADRSLAAPPQAAIGVLFKAPLLVAVSDVRVAPAFLWHHRLLSCVRWSSPIH